MRGTVHGGWTTWLILALGAVATGACDGPGASAGGDAVVPNADATDANSHDGTATIDPDGDAATSGDAEPGDSATAPDGGDATSDDGDDASAGDAVDATTDPDGGDTSVEPDTFPACTTTVAPGGELVVDVPMVSVQFDITLDGGGPFVSRETQEIGGIYLQRTAETGGGDRTLLGWVGGFVDGHATWQTRVVPGTYDVYFDHYYDPSRFADDFRGNELPINHSEPIARAVVLAEGAEVDLDVPMATVEIALTLDGGAFQAAPAPYTGEVGEVALVSKATGARTILGWVSGTWNMPKWTTNVIPGRYDVVFDNSMGWPEYYTDDRRGHELPANDSEPIATIELHDGSHVTVDLKKADALFQITRAGGLFVDEPQADEPGAFYLTSIASGTRTLLGWVLDWNAVAPFEAHMIPGRYRLEFDSHSNVPDYYEEDERGVELPINQGASLGEFDIQDGATLHADLGFAAVKVTVTLNGAGFVDDPDYEDLGTVSLVAKDTGAETLLGWVGGGWRGPATFEMHVVPGRYDVVYACWQGWRYVFESDPRGPELPVNQTTVIARGVDLHEGAAVTVDVPMTFVTLHVTLGGGDFVPHGNIQDYGSLDLIAADGSVTRAGWVGGGFDGPAVIPLHVVPGDYDVVYDDPRDASPYEEDYRGIELPLNHGEVVARGLHLGDSADVSLDIPWRPLKVRMTLNGGDFVDHNTLEIGQVDLVSRTTHARTPLGFVGGFVAGQQRIETSIIPGTYDLRFTHWTGFHSPFADEDRGVELPIDADAPIGCGVIVPE